MRAPRGPGAVQVVQYTSHEWRVGIFGAGPFANNHNYSARCVAQGSFEATRSQSVATSDEAKAPRLGDGRISNRNEGGRTRQAAGPKRGQRTKGAPRREEGSGNLTAHSLSPHTTRRE
ncbi:hypothetical protein AAFF_G00058310 [Aldrovandia affinis]|uniref:Uncharacterized protein n=1 Tax=Aldrovandia affinis TaxID=143900 RepID=A0AAD7WE28_9TELE|nr:hypothetical protein AAFF_G00058310 [Aldrovandia affinis]